ncbi:hypothetical protein LT679_01340 [Mucilaginibacter roseus]|uniref:Aromatic hydrocarbon degradation protein n=1 Tax=Mucilaginibacter roseus TaxID=1528868 RepID=A0ABS8U108_9SPHI|nr:hypothetical protein [Mucilaginibacter roseus]MCD8739231.1 hypothetical protein [Mucilaginibacter roseus]
MKFKHILSAMAMVAIAKSSFAQYSQDAIRFSTTQPGSTARIKAIGNANVAVGGDLTSVSGNPAGLGFFTRSEISVTPELNIFKSKSDYLGNTTNDSKNNGNLNNAAAVFYSQLSTARGAKKTEGWLSLNFGLGYSRTNNFYDNTTYGGNNRASSISDYYTDRANASGTDLLADWAYAHKLVRDYRDQNNNQYYGSAVIIDNNTPAVQRNVITRSGGQSEFNLSLGANNSNKFYVGASLGIATINYNSTQVFSESGDLSYLQNNTNVTRGFQSAFMQDQATRGTGANIKLGMIYKPVEALRLGLNFTSPTWYNMEDTYRETLATDVSGDNSYRNSEVYTLNYDLRTPLKVAGGIAYFFKNYGFITGDVEYVDYSSARLMSNDSYDAEYEDNPNIRTFYKGAINTRVGAEARLGKFAYLRGGYNVFGNPMKDNGSNIKTASGGLGFRSGHYSVDATYLHSTGSNTVFPYEVGDASPSALINGTNDNLYLTVSYRF